MKFAEGSVRVTWLIASVVSFTPAFWNHNHSVSEVELFSTAALPSATLKFVVLE